MAKGWIASIIANAFAGFVPREELAEARRICTQEFIAKNEAQDALESAHADNAALREALVFYADKSNWDNRMTGSEGGEEEATVYTYGEVEIILCGAKADEHGWERAESALASPSTRPPK